MCRRGTPSAIYRIVFSKVFLPWRQMVEIKFNSGARHGKSSDFFSLRTHGSPECRIDGIHFDFVLISFGSLLLHLDKSFISLSSLWALLGLSR